MMKPRGVLAVLLLGILALAGCRDAGTTSGASSEERVNPSAFRILSASENKDLETTIKAAAQTAGMEVELRYMGSVDIMRELQRGKASGYDAVWPADSMWLTLGDQSRAVKDVKSIMKSPIVFGLKRSIADRLGWSKGKQVRVQEILAAAKRGEFRYAMTSASQSNSGAAAFFGYLTAFAGKRTALSSSDLKNPRVLKQTRDLLHQVDRSSASSGFLTEQFVKDSDRLDGMVNYESQIIEANKQLTQQGREPLYVIYPADGLVIADYPLGYISQGDARKAAFFARFQAKLLEPSTQQQVVEAGRRPGGIGANIESANAAVFNPDWGIDTKRILGTIPMPSEGVIREAIGLFQTALRKPSLTVFVLDYSGSMNGNGGANQVKDAMELLLNPSKAEQYFLQPSARDINIVVAFSSQGEAEVWRAEGNRPETLLGLLSRVRAKEAGGDTYLFEALGRAFKELASTPSSVRREHLQSIILMSDGQPTDSISMFEQATGHGFTKDVPVFTIGFGDADPSFMLELANKAGGAYFDGKAGDLAGQFRKAKGYN